MQDSQHPLSSAKDTAQGSRAQDSEGRRKRAKPGERRDQILQTLASMLEEPRSDRITTAALAARLEVSEAALYRHFASKAQMFEGLIDFIEQSVFVLINRIAEMATNPDADVNHQTAKSIVNVVIQFAERNPGLVRVMVGDALVLENERLLQRMNLFFDKIESTLKQCLRNDFLRTQSTMPDADSQVLASVLAAFVSGRMQRYVRTGYRRLPSEFLEQSLQKILG